MNPNTIDWQIDPIDITPDPWSPPIDLGGGSGGSGGGGWWDVADDLLGDLGVYDWIRGLLGGSDSGGGASQSDKEKALLILAKDQTLLGQFYSFMQDLGTYGGILAQMMTGSILSWPGLIQDAILYWASKNRPGAFSADGSFIDNNFLGDFRDVGGGSAMGPPVPSPGTGLPVVGGGWGPFGMPVIPAVPKTQYKARKGYVIVTDPDTGAKYEMEKNLAYKLKLATRRKKAPITGVEYHYIKKAKAWESKLAKMLGDSCNFKVTKKR